MQVPKGATPLSNQSRNLLFEIIGYQRLDNAKVLDLYAGSGSNGLEALLRGAAKSTFVDITIDSTECIAINLRRLGLSSKAEIVSQEVSQFLRDNRIRFDIIFIDPPTPKSQHASLSGLNSHLVSDGLVIYRHPTNSARPYLNGLKALDSRTLKTKEGEVMFLTPR